MKTKKLNKKAKVALKNPWFYVSVIAVAIIIVLAYKIMIPANPETGEIVNKPANANQPTIAPASVSMDDDAFEGEEDAPVTIIEFSDFECPFCGRFYTQTLGQIKENYIKTGKVKLVYRDFPLSFHANAQKAAEAAECAGEQGKYFEMHDKLFEEGVSGGVASFKQYAKDIGLNTDDFDDCLDSGKMEDEVQKDFSDGQKAGVQGTPAFFINGKSIVGAQPYSVFEQAIEQELNG